MSADDDQLADLKLWVCEALASILDRIDRQRRDPDPWEQDHLITAISLLYRGAYRPAGLQAANAAADPSRRDPHHAPPAKPAYGTSILRQALAEAAAEPLRQWPHLGRIAFTSPGSAPDSSRLSRDA